MILLRPVVPLLTRPIMNSIQACVFTTLLIAAPIAAAPPSPNSLLGIHWYGDTAATDVESMSAGLGIWALEITHVDATQAPPWDQPAFHAGRAATIASRGHGMVFRMQPYWSRNVPHAADPYTLAQYANDAKAAANTLKNDVRVFQIGNEVNLTDENRRWDGAGYNTPWNPTPAEYAATYLAVRDKIHEVAFPGGQPPIVLIQPNSPGNAGGSRFMDGNEFLWRTIDAIPDKSKIDGFGLHSYAEPGGSTFGYDGFLDALREQIMVIDSFGLGDRPLFITEFNKHMPNTTECDIGARFTTAAFNGLNAWNAGTGGTLPGLPNHNIVSAMWFVYPADAGDVNAGWNQYSLKWWKDNRGSTAITQNPWYAFQDRAANLAPPAGAIGGGPTSIPQDTLWWQDTFSAASIDQTAPLPDCRLENANGGSVVAFSSTGEARLLGNGGAFAQASLRTAGYVFDDFRLETTVTFTNGARSNVAAPEANFDLRVREGSKGYSLTFFTSQSPTNPSRIILRRTSDWTQIGSFNQLVGGAGINNGSRFQITVIADGGTLRYIVRRATDPTPLLDWTVNDSQHVTGYIRAMTYNTNEVRLDTIAVGGPDWVPASNSLRVY